MLHVIGLGLGDATDVTVKGIEIIRTCDRVYLETYTSILSVGLKDLEQFFGCSILEADRELVEGNADEILPKDEKENVAFLVVGDPFGATTHADLILRAKQNRVKVISTALSVPVAVRLDCQASTAAMMPLAVNVVHNSSILTAVGCCGLQLYRFGETVSIPYWDQDWQPSSFYDKIISNRRRDLHTLCLLDIKVKEPTLESITKKKKEYMPARFMSVSEAATQLLRIVERKTDTDTDTVEEEAGLDKCSLVVGLARVGWHDQRIVARSLQEISRVDLGPPLHCFIVPAVNLHPVESEFLTSFIS